jgi:hypothetical protein
LAADKGYVTSWPEELMDVIGDMLTMVSKHLVMPHSKLSVAMLLLQTTHGERYFACCVRLQSSYL